MNHLISSSNFGKIEDSISKIKDLMYILEDEGFGVYIKIGKSHKKISIYIYRRVNGDLGNLMYKYTQDGSILEFVERASEILENNGYFKFSTNSDYIIKTNHSFLTPHNSTESGLPIQTGYGLRPPLQTADFMKYTYRIKTL